MSTIGYYRYKIAPSSNTNVTLYINNVLVSTKSIIINEYCSDDKRIKFLNKDGQYRFLSFNRFWESNDKPKELGKASKVITSLLNSQTSENSIGYKNERSLTVVAKDISQDELTILSDLWLSPRVYLYVGDETTDETKDWIQVEINSKNNVVKIKKGSYVDLTMEIILPEWYTISML